MATEYSQSTISEMVESERRMVLEAHERYPVYYPHAEEAAHFLSTFIKSINEDRFVFGMFLSQVKKHHMLALFSTVRLHRIQAMMNLRQVLEAGAAAAFGIANPGQEHFVDADDRGVLDPSKKLTEKRNKWLDEHYAVGSAAIRDMKDNINRSAGHANLVSAGNNFRFNDAGWFDAPFFDIEDEHFVRTDLWMLGNIAIGLMRLFHDVNKGRDVIVFVDEFPGRWDKLSRENTTLHTELTSSDRYKRAQQLIQETASVAPSPADRA